MQFFTRAVVFAGALLLPIALLSFQCYDDGSQVMIDEETEPLPFERVARGQQADFSDTLEAVVEDSASWQTLVSAFPEQAQARVREVDFERLMILVVALPVPTGGYDVQFRSIEIVDERVVAHYAVGTPGEDCITAMGITVPFDAIAVRRVDLPVEFERSAEPIPCTFR